MQDPEHHRGVNIGGLSSVLDAADHYGMSRVVTLGTTTYFDFKTSPLTETSPVDPDAPLDPYTQTKRAAYLEAMRRADEGLDVCVVIPGGTYGPAPATQRAMEAPSFNLRILQAMRGELTETVRFPIPWALAADVAAASVAALDRGRRGETYLAFGPPGDVSTMATFLNRACELAGVRHRVREIGAEDLDADPALKSQISPSLEALTRQRFPEPYFINDTTVARLDYQPHVDRGGLTHDHRLAARHADDRSRGVTTPDTDAKVQELWDRDRIARLPRTYARGVDRRDWDLVRSCFADGRLHRGLPGHRVDRRIPGRPDTGCRVLSDHHALHGQPVRRRRRRPR